MYQNVFINKKEGTVYLWDDEKGMTTFPYRRYAYRRAPGGNNFNAQRLQAFGEIHQTGFVGNGK